MCWQDPRKLSNCADMFNPLNAATRVARAPRPRKPAPPKPTWDSRPRLSSGAKLRRRCDEQTQTWRLESSAISSRCHPEQSERSMHSACSTSKWPTLHRFSPVILSAADTSQSEVPAESKDPYPSAAVPERQGTFTVGTHLRGLPLAARPYPASESPQQAPAKAGRDFRAILPQQVGHGPV